MGPAAPAGCAVKTLAAEGVGWGWSAGLLPLRNWRGSGGLGSLLCRLASGQALSPVGREKVETAVWGAALAPSPKPLLLNAAVNSVTKRQGLEFWIPVRVRGTCLVVGKTEVFSPSCEGLLGVAKRYHAYAVVLFPVTAQSRRANLPPPGFPPSGKLASLGSVTGVCPACIVLTHIFPGMWESRR